MSFLQTILAWHWLVFLLPLLFSLVMLLGAALGGSGESDADADVDVDGHVHVHHEADFDLGSKFWTFLGVGRVPLMYLLSIIALLFGGTGLVAQKILTPSLFFVNLGLAVVAVIGITPLVARIAARLLPQTETYVGSSTNQTGNSGRLVVATDEKFGLVQIKDRYGNEYRCKCRTYPGAQPLGKGTEVLLVEYSDEVYYVEQLQMEMK